MLKGGRGGNTVRNVVGAMMMVVFTIAEINYLVVPVSLFNELARPLSFLYLILTSLAGLLVLNRATAIKEKIWPLAEKGGLLRAFV